MKKREKYVNIETRKGLNTTTREMKFYEEIGCEHGWTDNKGFAHCNLGSGCSIGLECYCVKEDCPIWEENG